MLQRGQPAVGIGCREFRIAVALDIQILGLRSIGNRRSLERIRLDIEIRARSVFPVTQELSVRRQLSRRSTVVLYIVFKSDAVLTALEDKGLDNGEALTVAPGERHAQFTSAPCERESFLFRGPCRQMRRRGFAGAAD